jgi:hypothetical protein
MPAILRHLTFLEKIRLRNEAPLDLAPKNGHGGNTWYRNW